MWLKKFTIILTALPFSLCLACGCSAGVQTQGEIEELAQAGDGAEEEDVTVYVVTRYGRTQVVAAYSAYDGWKELLEGEFDGRDSDRAEVRWRGDYVVSVGNLRPDDPSRIVLYLNGVYSNHFVKNCEYKAGYTLSFVEKGAVVQ